MTTAYVDPYEEIDAAIDGQALTAAVAGLPERERRIVENRLGLEGRTPQTLEELGRELGLTRERVRQLETRALKRLGARLPGATRRRAY